MRRNSRPGKMTIRQNINAAYQKGKFSPVNARELQLYAENDSQLYHQMRHPIEINLAKKHIKGIYDKDKAVKAWESFYDVAGKKYEKEFKAVPSTMFSPSERKAAAIAREREFRRELELGNI